jgi:hypothetical protein
VILPVQIPHVETLELRIWKILLEMELMKHRMKELGNLFAEHVENRSTAGVGQFFTISGQIKIPLSLD